MTGYTRVYNKSTNDVVEAGDFNTEFQSLDDSHDASSGHKHDGTAQEGAFVPTISGVSNNNAVEVDEATNTIKVFIDVSSSKVQQVQVIDGAILPVTDDDIDLGSASKEFKDLYIDGTANIDVLTATAGTVGGSNIVTLAATQTLTSKTLTTPTITGPVIDVLDTVVITGSIEEETFTLTGLDLDPANGTIQTKVLAAPVTLTNSLTDGEFITLHIEGGDVHTVTWPTVTWMSGSAPILASKNVIEFWYIGAVLYGASVGPYT